LEAQTQTTFSDAALAGNYLLGTLAPLIKGQSNADGEIDLLGSGSITDGISNAGINNFSWDQADAGLTYNWLSTTYGTFSVSSGPSCAVISATKVACVNNSATSPSVNILEQ
jgi:hypothetical protein